MTCTGCGHDNRPGREFCVECGAVLPLACPACNAPYDAGEKFCGECGAPLAAAPVRPSAGVAPSALASAPTARKVVTVIFDG